MQPGMVVCLLNEAKSAREWMPYYPFTLSIRDAEHLFQFIRGDFTLIVTVDPKELIKRFAESGIKTVMRLDEEYVIWMRRAATDAGASGVSRQMFNRLFFEFQSLSWFVSANGDEALRIEKTLGEQVAQMQVGVSPNEGWLREYPQATQRINEELDAIALSAPIDESEP